MHIFFFVNTRSSCMYCCLLSILYFAQILLKSLNYNLFFLLLSPLLILLFFFFSSPYAQSARASLIWHRKFSASTSRSLSAICKRAAVCLFATHSVRKQKKKKKKKKKTEKKKKKRGTLQIRTQDTSSNTVQKIRAFF